MAAPYDSFTDFPNGVTSFGVPLFGGANKFVSAAWGRTWFVNANSTTISAGMNPGSNGNSGQSPTAPFLTMAKAFSVISNGDVINFTGKITEQLVTPVQVFDVWVHGCGTRPRHADSTPAGGQYGASQWAPPTSGAVSGQATCRVLQQGWRFSNILWTAEGATAACLEIVRNAGAGDAERDASSASVLGCRFAGTGIGIRMTATSFTENPFNVLIQGNTFNGCTTAILAAAAQPNMVQILDNYFPSNTSTITAQLQASIIARNIINIFTAASSSGGIDVRNGGGNNLITGNWLGGAFTNAGGYNGAAGDKWWGNFADVAGGVTQADPA